MQQKDGSQASITAAGSSHTFRLIQCLGQEDIRDIMTQLNFTPQEQLRLFSNDNFQRVHRSLNSHYPEVGIKNFSIFRRDDYQTRYPVYYATVEIEPLVLITGSLTVELFRATENNVRQLQDSFHNVMGKYLTHNSLTNLASWQCSRIDYTTNLRFNSTQDKDLFLELTRKTSRHVRKQPKRIIDLRLNEQSTAEGNSSIKVIFYDKRKQIEETYNDIPPCQQLSLAQASDNLIRFEVQCLRGRVLTIKRKYRFEDRCILRYLSEDIAQDVLISEYKNSVGSCNFYSFYWATKKIEESAFSAPKKQRLIQFLQLIAQARHVSIAREQFIEGTQIKRTDITVQGSNSTFKNYLRALTDLGINPMLIPKERRVTHFENPISQLY